MTDRTPFWIEGLHVRSGNELEEKTFTRTTIWRGNDPRPVILGGDAYWQWGESPYRNNHKGFCWTQALHDGLEGWHATIFHAEENPRFCVLPEHPDYAHVLRIWNLVNDGVMVPDGFPDEFGGIGKAGVC